MPNVANAVPNPPERAGLYRRAADVAGRYPAEVQPHDDDAVAHLDAGRRRQVLRGVCGVHDRRCAAADRAPIQYHRRPERLHQRREPVRNPDRRCRPGQLVGSVRPQVHVHRGDDHLHRVPWRRRVLQQLRFPGDLPVRARDRPGLRLSDRAHDHFRKHPQHQPGQIGAGRVRLPGRGRPGRHGGRLCGAGHHAESQCLALDVCNCGCSRPSGHHRPLLRHGKCELAALSRIHRSGHGCGEPATEAHPAIPLEYRAIGASSRR